MRFPSHRFMLALLSVSFIYAGSAAAQSYPASPDYSRNCCTKASHGGTTLLSHERSAPLRRPLYERR